MSAEELDTHQKALRINLDPRWYGTLAEIGAGQEVVRWFFRVGAAAGTVAKSISAYDMTVSDAIYGSGDRYVSRTRLQAMLDREFSLNVERLSEKRGDNTAFFAFADTVVARSFKGGNECHGWMGVKFQSRPRDEPSQILIHVRMLDTEASLQQEALGVVGVNLLYGAFFLHHEPELLVESLLDKLTTGRIEIDVIEFKGIEFRSVDNRLISLKLVQLGLSGAAMFGSNHEVLQPSEVLYKKAVLVERGSFRPPTHVNFDMLQCALEKFKADPAVEGKEVLPLFELTMRNLLAGGNDIDRRDFLARADLLAACGMTVLISDYFEYYRLAALLAWRPRSASASSSASPALPNSSRKNTTPSSPAASSSPSVGSSKTTSSSTSIRCATRNPENSPPSRTSTSPRTPETLRLPRRSRQFRRTRQLQTGVSENSSPAMSSRKSPPATKLGRTWSREAFPISSGRGDSSGVVGKG